MFDFIQNDDDDKQNVWDQTKHFPLIEPHYLAFFVTHSHMDTAHIQTNLVNFSEILFFSVLLGHK